MGSTNALGLLFYSKFLQIVCPKSLSWVTAYFSLSRMINSKKVHQCFYSLITYAMSKINYILSGFKGGNNVGSTNVLGLLFYSKFLQIICPKSVSWVTSYISLSRMINSKKVHQCFYSLITYAMSRKIDILFGFKGGNNVGSTNALGLLFYSKFLQIICPKFLQIIRPKSLSLVTAYISLSRMINFKKVHQCFYSLITYSLSRRN